MVTRAQCTQSHLKREGKWKEVTDLWQVQVPAGQTLSLKTLILASRYTAVGARPPRLPQKTLLP